MDTDSTVTIVAEGEPQGNADRKEDEEVEVIDVEVEAGENKGEEKQGGGGKDQGADGKEKEPPKFQYFNYDFGLPRVNWPEWLDCDDWCGYYEERNDEDEDEDIADAEKDGENEDNEEEDKHEEEKEGREGEGEEQDEDEDEEDEEEDLCHCGEHARAYNPEMETSDEEDPLEYDSSNDSDDKPETDTNPSAPKILNQRDITQLKAGMLAHMPGDRFVSLPPVLDYFKMLSREELMDLLTEHLEFGHLKSSASWNKKTKLSIKHPNKEIHKILEEGIEMEWSEEETEDYDYKAGLDDYNDETLQRMLRRRFGQMTTPQIWQVLIEPRVSDSMLAIMELYGAAVMLEGAKKSDELYETGLGCQCWMEGMDEGLKDFEEDW